MKTFAPNEPSIIHQGELVLYFFLHFSHPSHPLSTILISSYAFVRLYQFGILAGWEGEVQRVREEEKHTVVCAVPVEAQVWHLLSQEASV